MQVTTADRLPANKSCTSDAQDSRTRDRTLHHGFGVFSVSSPYSTREEGGGLGPRLCASATVRSLAI